MSLMLRFTARSHVGRVREGNEDSGYAGARLLVVADGMGGHAAGEVASAAAISALTELDTINVTDPRASLREAVREADRRLQILVEDDSARAGMGTTLTALLWDGRAFTMAHVGDSRAYFLRDGQLGQITHDHTFVQTLVDEGRISATEAEHHPQRSLILRALDGRGRVEPDIDVINAQDGDRFLVCSDGLSGFVSVEDMTTALGTGDIDTAADRLIELALEAGAPDNVTCIIGEVYDSDDTGVLPPTVDGVGPNLSGILVGAAAEPDAPWSGAANVTTEQPDRRLHDPEEDSEENEAELLRYAPRPPSRYRWFRRGLVLLIVVAVLGGLAYAGMQWNKTQYYVGVDDNQVAIYQGLDQQIVGISLSDVYELYEVPVEDLPTFDQTAIEDSISADSLDDARSIADRLRLRALACERFRTQAEEQEEDDEESGSVTVPPTTSPGTTTAPGQQTTPATTRPGGQPTTDHPRATETTDDVTPTPTESSEPDFTDPVTREECGVFASMTATMATGRRERPPNPGADAPPQERRRRLVELVMLVIAVAITMGAYATVHLARDGSLPASLPAYTGGLLLLALVAHVAVRRFAPYADPVILPCVVLLNGLGLVLIHRLDLGEADIALARGNPIPTPDAPLQLTWTAVGVALFVVVLVVVRDHRQLQKATFTIGAIGILFLLLPLVPGLGTTVNGSRLWIRAGGLSFQPGELAKLALIIFFAGYLVVHRDALALAGKRFMGLDLPRARDLGPILLAWAASLGVLVFQKDLGSSLLFFGVFVTLLYVATERASWLLYGFVLFFSGAYFAFTQFSHVQVRVELWLNPFPDAPEQISESLFGLAAGGLIGTGLTQGYPERVPFAKTDFIIATLGEELGLAGLMAVIMLYAIIVERGLRTSLIVRDGFGKLLATGLSVSLALQLFVVVGGVTNLIPLTGLTTPFLSYGGSSMIANWILVALLLRVSNAARRPAPPVAPASPEEMTQVVRL